MPLLLPPPYSNDTSPARPKIPRMDYSHIDVGNAVDWDHPLNRKRIGWWYTPVGSGAGSKVIDLTGKTHGTFTNQNGKLNYRVTNRGDLAFVFDSTASQYINFGKIKDNSYVGSSDFTYAIWVYHNSAADFSEGYMQDGVDNAAGVVTFGYTGGVLVNQTGGSTHGVVSRTPTVGKWERIVATYQNGVRLSLYANGVRVDTITSFTGSWSGFQNHADFRIGWEKRFNTYTNGMLSDPSLWLRALSAEEVALDYNLSRQGYRTPDSPLRWHNPKGYSFGPGLVSESKNGQTYSAIDVGNPINQGHPLSKNRVAWWINLNGVAVGATVRDLLGKRPAAYTGIANWGSFSPAGGTPAKLNGTSDRVQILGTNKVLFTDQDFTISAWVRTSTPSVSQTIFDSGDSGATPFAILDTASSKFQFSFRGASGGVIVPTVSATTVVANTWYHVVAVKNDPAALRQLLYVNGVLEGTGAGASLGSVDTSDANNQLIGANFNGGSIRSWWAGEIDDVQVWVGRSLTPGDIRELYLQGRAGYKTSNSPLRWAKSRSYFGVSGAVGVPAIPSQSKSRTSTNIFNSIDVGNAINWTHPLNHERAAWWYVPKGLGAGGRYVDLVGRANGNFSEFSRPTWMNTPFGNQGVAYAHGSFHFIDCGAAPKVRNGALTATAWVRQLSAKTNATIMCRFRTASNDRAWTLFTDSSDSTKISATISETGLSSGLTTATSATSTLTVGKWHRIAFVYVPSTRLTVYVDGNQVAENTTSVPASLYASAANLTIGGQPTVGSAPWDGDIADPSVWNRSLSAQDILDDFRISKANYQVPDSPLRWTTYRNYPPNRSIEAKSGRYAVNNYSRIDVGNAVNWDHPLNKGRIAWFRTVEGRGHGQVLRNLVGKMHGNFVAHGTTAPLQFQQGSSSLSGSVPLKFSTGSHAVDFAAGENELNTDKVTVSFDLYFDNLPTGSNQYAIIGTTASGEAGGWMIIYQNNFGVPRFLFRKFAPDLSVICTWTAQIGRWYRFVGTHDGTTASVYIDGVLINSGALASPTVSSWNFLRIGADGRFTSNLDTYNYISLIGRLADVSLHNRGLSANEVAADYYYARNQYKTPDSPLRWISSKSYFDVTSIVGTVIPVFMNQYRQRWR